MVKNKVCGSTDSKDSSNQCGKCTEIKRSHKSRENSTGSSDWYTGRLVQNERKAHDSFSLPEYVQEEEQCNANDT